MGRLAGPLHALVMLAVVLAAGACAATPPDAGAGTGTGGVSGVPASGPIVGTPLATFDSDAAGFGLNPFAEATNLALAPSRATLAWISTDGSPDAGCLKVTAPYSGANQWVDVEATAFSAPLPDWTGKTLHVRLKLEAGSTFSGSLRLYVKTGAAYIFYPTGFVVHLEPSGWQEFMLPLVSPAPVPPANAGADPVQIATYGVDPLSGAALSSPPAPITFYVDSFSLE